MSSYNILELVDALPRFEQFRFDKPINWKIKSGENWALIGPNGAGKTILTDIISGKYTLKSGQIQVYDPEGAETSISKVIKTVAFKDIYSITDLRNSYYQQRWNRGDERNLPLVNDLFVDSDQLYLQSLVALFGIQGLMEKEINLLSSGELRKILIIRALLSQPKLLILDNPYIGLDSRSRDTLNDLFSQLITINRVQLVLVVSNPADIPDCIDKILPIADKHLYDAASRKEFLKNKGFISQLFPETKTSTLNEIVSLYPILDKTFEYAIAMKNLCVKYGSRTILKNLNWQVKQGEKWALLGANGSGKSTLLSLVCGDNPQAYANDIRLFDNKRGSGESIWDIKKRIGYLSPEMHLYYMTDARCLDVVGSGFFDSIGIYRKCNQEQEVLAGKWMQIFGVDHLKERSFLSISSGEQRLVLLARAFVKNPELLILDEPLHGLDISNKKRVKQIIEDFCDENKSLIYVTHYKDEIPAVVDKQLELKIEN